MNSQPANGEYWGAFDDVKNSYVEDLNIWYDGEEIYEPLSCYSDLANVNSFTITPVKDGLVINIDGGDASTAYKAQIVCKGDDVVQRTVRDGEFPDQCNEKSLYKNEVISNISVATR